MEDSTESPICTDEAKASVKPEGDRACPLYRGLADDLNHQCLSLGVWPFYQGLASTWMSGPGETRDKSSAPISRLPSSHGLFAVERA